MWWWSVVPHWEGTMWREVDFSQDTEHNEHHVGNSVLGRVSPEEASSQDSYILRMAEKSSSYLVSNILGYWLYLWWWLVTRAIFIQVEHTCICIATSIYSSVQSRKQEVCYCGHSNGRERETLSLQSVVMCHSSLSQENIVLGSGRQQSRFLETLCC